MPSDKHNSRTAWARDLISSLINVASFQDVPFHQWLQCETQISPNITKTLLTAAMSRTEFETEIKVLWLSRIEI